MCGGGKLKRINSEFHLCGISNAKLPPNRAQRVGTFREREGPEYQHGSVCISGGDNISMFNLWKLAVLDM